MRVLNLAVAGLAFFAPIAIHASSGPNPFPRLTEYRGIRAPEAPLSRTLPPLIIEAGKGDGVAAARIYAGLSKCRTLRREVDRTAADDYCSGIAEATVSEAGDYLSNAANAANPDAQYVYALAGFQELINDSAGYPARSSIDSYRSRAASILSHLANQCNASAIQHLYRGRRYGEGLIDSDFPGAYQMLVTLSIVRPDLVTAHDFSDLEVLMIPGDIGPARQRGERFVDEHCR